MKPHPKLLSFLSWLLVTCLSVVFINAILALIAKVTHSGLGSCGPYGPVGGLLIGGVLLSVPVSILAGVVAADRLRSHYVQEEKKA